MRYFTVFILLAVLFTACKKDEDQSIIDDDIILKYLKDKNLTATKDASGLYYIVYNEGSGGYPTINSTVEVKYKGYLTSGYVFDQTSGSSTASLPLANLIKGWQIGIPLLQKGGNGLFLLPSALGYGNNAQSDIPANSVLIFEITLVDF
jgi:FKBP-type peptidyl-prolyl cis-trans isomerase